MQALTRIFRGHWQIMALCAVVFALWPTDVIYPLRLLIVFLHELSHAIAVILTGGEVVSLSVNAMEGGEVLARGGNRFLTLSAGYVGSLLIGVILLLTAVNTRADRIAMMCLGALILGVTLLYSSEPFAVIFGIATAALMLAAAAWLNHDINDLILRVIGLTSMIYVPYDIFSDTIARAHLYSDARMLAEEFGGTTMIWGGLWLAISLAVIVASLRYGLGGHSNIRFRRG
ncbi:M50 family metallopeptidase [Shimia sediminis]|uniref:M50 family metallopeptidase n=1 Tax=Shimia sediminis TaxID=2497945 RepID=UPI000F8DA3E7|nr:M50 family metallopeptidase [Shimia sediminis]